MIRWATEADRPAILAILHAGHLASSWYVYDDMDGYCLVDEREGTIRGYVTFDLGKPETHIRQIVVHPDWAGTGLVVRRLLRALVQAASTYGSQGIGGFHFDVTPELKGYSERLGAYLQPGVLARWVLTPLATERAAKWAAHLKSA